jgi:predicted metal-dependent phosphoesterase TrpH
MPFDCGVEMAGQLEKALEKQIDVLFVTNHNTLDGYRQITDYQGNHNKFSGIKIYPAEEVTIKGGGHVLAYGIYETIRSGMTLEETLDEIRRQGGVSCAAHPFAVTNGIRERAAMCDMIESFNSNNVDRYSNVVAGRFAKEKKMPEIAGSDSHVLTTIGRCMNVVEAENNLDSILAVMKKGTRVDDKGYASRREVYEHAHYIINSSRELLLEYASVHHRSSYPIVKWALDSYAKNPHGFWWRSVGTFALYLAERISEKVNIRGHDPEILENRSWAKLIPMGLMP